MNAFGDPVHLCSDSLNVRIPSTLGSAVRVAYIHAEGRPFPTYLTNCCHRALPSTRISREILSYRMFLLFQKTKRPKDQLAIDQNDFSINSMRFVHQNPARYS